MNMSFNFDDLKEMSKNPMFWMFFIFCCGASFSLGMAVGPLVLNNQHAAFMVFIGVFALISLYIWRCTSAKNPDKIDGGVVEMPKDV